ncbi:MAG: hypothetical protein HY660_09695 [Armatimonadetes bacterium]|nr:hypothetical protein [Armatimonadota bacterium]
MTNWRMVVMVAGVLAVAALAQVPAMAGPLVKQTPVAGAYSTLGATVNGQQVRRATQMPWLYLLEDFTYEWGSARGTYRVEAGRVLLAGPYQSWGPGRIAEEPGRRLIIFHYTRTDQAGRAQLMNVTLLYRGPLHEYPPPSRRSGASTPSVSAQGPAPASSLYLDVKSRLVFPAGNPFSRGAYPDLDFVDPSGQDKIAHRAFVDKEGRFRVQLHGGLVYDLYFFYFTNKEKVGTVDMTRANPAALAIVCQASQSKVTCRG